MTISHVNVDLFPLTFCVDSPLSTFNASVLFKPGYSTLELDAHFIIEMNCTTFWPSKVLSVYFDLYVPDFQKGTSKKVVRIKTFSSQGTQLWSATLTSL